MTLKLNISESGKAYKLEIETDVLSGKSIGDKFDGKEINSDLSGYELEITGGSDIAGFPMKSDVEGLGLRRVLLTKGWGMHDKKKGIRLRKTVRGKVIGDKVVQVNLNVVKVGNKKLSDIFGSGGKEEIVVEGSVPYPKGHEQGTIIPAHPETPAEEKV